LNSLWTILSWLHSGELTRGLLVFSISNQRWDLKFITLGEL
jgi:hypothetical protein